MAITKLVPGSWNLPRVSMPAAVTSGVLSRLEVSSKFAFRREPPVIIDPYGSDICKQVKEAKTVEVEAQSILFFPNGRLFSQRMISINDTLYSDIMLDEPTMASYLNNSFDVSTRDTGLYHVDDGYQSTLLNSDVTHVDCPVVLLTSSEPMNYGAWLIRVLPKIYYIRDIIDISTVKFICYCNNDWQMKLLEFCGIQGDQIIKQDFRQIYQAPTIICPSWPSRYKLLDLRMRGMVSQIVAKAKSERPDFVGPRAIYISRSTLRAKAAGQPSVRPFAQEEQLENYLRDLGFVVFSPEVVSFAEAVLTFASAEIVVGPQGAGMFNTIFCRAGTVVFDIEHLPFFLNGHCNMFSSCELNYHIIVGREGYHETPHPVHKPLEIDMQVTVDSIRNAIATIC